MKFLWSSLHTYLSAYKVNARLAHFCFARLSLTSHATFIFYRRSRARCNSDGFQTNAAHRHKREKIQFRLVTDISVPNFTNVRYGKPSS